MKTTQQFKPARPFVAVLSLSVVLAACGGGGGGGGSTVAGNSGSGGTLNTPTGPAQTPSPVPAGFESVTTLTKQAVANVSYFIQTIKAAATDEVVITLPATLATGDTVRVRGDTDIRWKLAQNTGQAIGLRTLPAVGQPGLNFVAGANSTHNWWFAASSASGQKLAAVGNSFQGLHPTGATASGTVWTSADGGLNWTERNTPGTPPSNPWTSIASSADGTKLAVVGIGIGIWTSANSGDTWSHTELDFSNISTTEFVSVSMTPDGSRMIATTLYTAGGNGRAGRIFTYEQGPNLTFGQGTWTRQQDVSSIQMWRCVALSADGNTVVAAASTCPQTAAQRGPSASAIP